MSGLAREKKCHEREKRTGVEEGHKCIDFIHSSIGDVCNSWSLGAKRGQRALIGIGE